MEIQDAEPQKVVVRDVRGAALLRWMVGTGERVAYVTDEGGLASIRAGMDGPSIGFPKKDVFAAPPTDCHSESCDWASLKRLFPDA